MKRIFNKTRKINHKLIIVQLLKFSNTVKLFHWNTRSYSLHISSDNLFIQLSLLIDKLVEIMLAKSRLPCFQSSISIGICNNDSFFFKLEQFKLLIISLKFNSDIANICDEIVNTIDQFSYLAAFKN